MAVLSERKAGSLIGFAIVGALFLATVAVFPGLRPEHILVGFLVLTFLLFFGVGKWVKKEVFCPPAPTLLAQSIIGIENDIQSLQGLLSKCLVVLDISGRRTSIAEFGLQAFVTVFYCYIFSLYVSPTIAWLLGSPYAALAFVFSVSVGLGLVFGELYTRYIKLVSAFLAGRNSERIVKDLTKQLTILQSRTSFVELKKEDRANLERSVESSLKMLLGMSDILKKTGQKISISQRILFWLLPLLPMSWVAQQFVGLFSAKMETIVMFWSSLTLIAMVLLIISYLIPSLRANNVLTRLGFVKLGTKIQETLSNLEAMMLDREILRLAQVSFLFSEGNKKPEAAKPG